MKLEFKVDGIPVIACGYNEEGPIFIFGTTHLIMKLLQMLPIDKEDE